MKTLLHISIAFCVMTLLGCTKDKDFQNGRYGFRDMSASPVGVGFPQASNTVNLISINFVSTNQSFTLPLVNLLSNEPADKDIHVTLQVNPALIAAYNAANDPDLEPFPAGTFTIPTLVVTIPKGQRTGTLTLNIPNATLLDASKRYALGYTIASVQEPGYTVAMNLKNVLFGFPIRNQYEGRYEVSVDLTGHPSASGHYDDDVTFTTIDGTSVDAPLAVAEIFVAASRLSIKVNPDNSLSLTSNATAINPLVPGLNYYDPATRTFHFDYTWGAGPRHIVGTARRL